MKRLSWGGVLVLLLGLLTALGPLYLFPACEKLVVTQAGNAIPMKCHWTAMAVFANGLIVTAAGLLLTFGSNAGLRLGTALMSALVSVITVLYPSVLIGVCAKETMTCHMVMAPSIYFLGGVTVVVSLLIAVGAAKACSKAGG